MEVVFAGIFLVVIGVFVCYFNYRIENKIIEKEVNKNNKIVQFHVPRRKMRFIKKKMKTKKIRKTNSYKRRVNSF